MTHKDRPNLKEIEYLILSQINLAILNEREACARIARDAVRTKFGMDSGTSEWIEAAIRARSTKK